MAFLLVVAPAMAADFKGEVIRVLDGDTIEILAAPSQTLTPKDRIRPHRHLAVLRLNLSQSSALGPLPVRVCFHLFVQPERVDQTGDEPNHKCD
jgi:hypothetical protein